MDEPLGQEYWAHHNSAANYAIANRWTIMQALDKAVEVVFGTGVEPYYEISHNLVQEETIVASDGEHTRRFVHRKGATRAFPAGHPDLRTSRWAETGHPVLIPGSMGTASYLLLAGPNAADTLWSVNHGAGRVMSRTAAAGSRRGRGRRKGKGRGGLISHEAMREAMGDVYLTNV